MNVTDINAVIIGEAGTGKSTLINYLANLFHHGSLSNLKVAIPTDYLERNLREDLDDRRQSNPCVKSRFLVQNVAFNFFDTSEYFTDDVVNIDAMVQCIQTLENLSAIVLVLNGSQARLTTNLRIVLDRVRDRMPDFFSANLIVILTHCTAHTVNFEAKKLFAQAPVFHMQNSAFASDPQTWSRQTRESLQHSWTASMQTLNQFIETILKFSLISTQSLATMNDDRNAIRSMLHESRLTIMKLQQIDDELRALEQARSMERDENQSRSIQVNEITVTPYHNTLCLQCNTVCHERCSLTETNQVGEHEFRRCTVMDSGHCSICPGRCSYEMHYHDRRLIKAVQRKVKFASHRSSENATEAAEELKFALERSLEEQLKHVQKTCIRLQKHCQSFNVAEELLTIINLLENDLHSFHSTAVVERAKEFIEQLKHLAHQRTPTHAKDRSNSSQKRKKIARVRADHSNSGHPNDDATRHYAEYPTEQLIALLRQSTETSTSIAEELNTRCVGQSIGYLSSTQLLTLCEYYASYRLLPIDQLVETNSELQVEIQGLTNRNPLEILSVPADKLLHLVAVTLCLEQTNSSQ